MTGSVVRDAATICLLRPGPAGLEVLMVRRSAGAAFMGGSFVFPGGAVDDCDRGAAALRTVLSDAAGHFPWHAAALRELAEEAGIWLLAPGDDAPAGSPRGAAIYGALDRLGSRFDARPLRFFSHWVTPRGLPRRFDTRFFLAGTAPGAPAGGDGEEVTEAVWVRPAEALQRADGGMWDVPFPTRRHLEILDRFDSPDEAADWAMRLDRIPRIEPRLQATDRGGIRVLLPGDPGYAEAPS